MTPQKKRAILERGAAAERRVADWLRGHGWQILERNWRGGGGELDIVAQDGARLRVVEVKQRGADDPAGGGLDAVEGRKRQRLVRAAEAWLDQYDGSYDEVCFAVAVVEGDAVTWIDDAFDA